MVIGIQYLRGIAALMVVLHHFEVQLNRHGTSELELNLQIGAAGVDIFFVVSGFIMTYLAIKRGPSPSEFLRDRLIRIVPLYWFYTALLAFIALAAPSLLKTSSLESTHLLASLFFVPVYHPVEGQMIWPLLIQGWTLNYEIFFYAIFAFTLLLTRKYRLGVLCMIISALVLAGLNTDNKTPIIQTYTDSLLLEFLCGAVMGQIYFRGYLTSSKVGAFLLLISLSLYFLSIENPYNLVRALNWGVPSVLLVAGVLCMEKNCQIYLISPLKKLGDSSFSLYLSHTFTLSSLGFFWSKIGIRTELGDYLFFFVSVTGTILVGHLSYSLLEKPLTKKFKLVTRQGSEKLVYLGAVGHSDQTNST